jgi:hypothetical protein
MYNIDEKSNGRLFRRLQSNKHGQNEACAFFGRHDAHSSHKQSDTTTIWKFFVVRRRRIRQTVSYTFSSTHVRF